MAHPAVLLLRRRTPAYWPTRIRLAVGIVATALTVVLAVVVVRATGRCFSCDPRWPLVAAAVGVGMALVGLVWMVRIFRGPRDEPPPWRYRDH